MTSVGVLILSFAPWGAMSAPSPVVERPSVWSDPLPFFRPDPRHTVASECSVSDAACIARHDDRAITLALMLGDTATCDHSTTPQTCRRVVEMTSGNYVPPPGIASDPCAFVVRIASGHALLYSAKQRRAAWVRHVPAWRPGSFVGACDPITGAPIVTAPKPEYPWAP